MEKFVAGLSVKATLRGEYYDALLGLGFLRNYCVTFDYAHKQVILERTIKTFAIVLMRAAFFIVVEPNSRLFVIKHVVPGSPGEEAGLKDGDVVESIDGKRATLLGLSGIRIKLQGPRERAVRIGIRREGQKLSATINLRKIF